MTSDAEELGLLRANEAAARFDRQVTLDAYARIAEENVRLKVQLLHRPRPIVNRPKIAVLNESSIYDDVKLEGVVAALQKQVTEHFAPQWGVDAKLYAFSKPEVHNFGNEQAWRLRIVDHLSENAPIGGVHFFRFAVPDGEVLAAGADDLGRILSHELLEMLVNPQVDLYPLDAVGKAHIQEVCDPVPKDEYEVLGIKINDFCLPSYFQADGVGPFTYLQSIGQPTNTITRPFQLINGGFLGLEGR